MERQRKPASCLQGLVKQFGEDPRKMTYENSTLKKVQGVKAESSGRGSGGKLSKFEAILADKYKIVSKQDERLRIMKKKVIEAKSMMQCLEDEMMNLKMSLTEKNSEILELHKQEQKLWKYLEIGEVKNTDVGKETEQLERFHWIEKEKLRFLEYENSFRDRKIMTLERKLRLAAMNPGPNRKTSMRLNLFWKRNGLFENELDPNVLEKLQVKAKTSRPMAYAKNPISRSRKMSRSSHR